MASVRRIFLLGLMAVLACMMASSQAYVIRSASEVKETATDKADKNDMMVITEMMTKEEEAEIDEMFPDQMRDDLKLELILKALALLKDFEGLSVSVSTWLPTYDVMPDELKLRLILKAIILLKDRPVDAMFAGHTVGELELTLILKALWIIEESKTDFSLAVDTGDLKLALLLKAIDLLEVYEGDFEDTVFFTESKKHLKLALILKAIALLKQGNWPIDIDDLWRMEGDDGEEEGSDGNQPEATTPEPTTITDAVTEEATDEAATSQATTASEEPATEVTTSKQTTVSEAVTEEDDATTMEATSDEGTPAVSTTGPEEPSTEATTAATDGSTTAAATSEGAPAEGTTVPEGAGETTATDMSEEQAATTEPAVVVNRGDIPESKKHWLKAAVGKVFRWFKRLPKTIHKKKHMIFH